MGLSGVGTDVAGQLLVTAGDNPQRLRSEAAFAMLCGAAPLPAGRRDATTCDALIDAVADMPAGLRKTLT